MKEPKQCHSCPEVVELSSMKNGLTHSTVTCLICSDCYESEEYTKERINEIRTALDNIDGCESEISRQTETRDECIEEIQHQEEKMGDSKSILIEYEYKGAGDPYHSLINEYY